MPVRLAVDELRPVRWNDAAYERLVLDPSIKDLVLSFVETHEEARELPTDVIKSKGKCFYSSNILTPY